MTWPAEGNYRFDRSTLARVFTFKVPGLMSPLAHDLELHTRAVTGTVNVSDDHAEVEATIDLWSLEVHAPLGGLQKREAEKTMRKKVLKNERDAKAALEGRVDRESGLLTGTLSLVGSRSRDVRIPVRIETVDDGRVTATLQHELLQTDFGITPYKAMLGALKLEDRLRVEIDAVLTAA